MNALQSVASGQVIAFRAPLAVPGFSSRDLMDLNGWHEPGQRMEIEKCAYGDAPDQSSFALVYQGDEPWASWGITREGAQVLAWDCVTHADIGQFPTVLAALDALPAPRRASVRVPAVRWSAEIIPLRRVALAG